MVSNVNNSPAGVPQFTPSSHDASGSRPAGVTPDGKKVAVPSALDAIDPKALTGLRGGEKQDDKSALRKEQAQKLAVDEDFRNYRSAMRKGYRQLREASDVLLAKLQSPNATGVKLLGELVKLAQDLHNTYINPVGESPLPLPPGVKQRLETHWVDLTDLQRKTKNAGVLSAEQRGQLGVLHKGFEESVASLKALANSEMDEDTILARYRATSPGWADLQQILSDPRQARRLEGLRALCKQTLNEENIAFLLRFSSIRSNPDISRIAAYRALFDEFVGPHADPAVNISHSLLKSVSKVFEQPLTDRKSESPDAPTMAAEHLKSIDAQMDAVHDEVFKLMLTNSYAQFRKLEENKAS